MKKRVLVVDDDRLVADTLNLVFQTNGFDCEARYSAAEGLAFARTFHPDMLLCDITMPERDGLEMAEDMDRELPDCRILMFTAHLANFAKVDERSARLRRPMQVLSKPCRPEDLLRRVDTMLQAA